ncbi:hypothetical protein PI859_30685, partial [Burkholderia pseudomallei]|nr:hypothetical protein [Burkholderia pseudomallei]
TEALNAAVDADRAAHGRKPLDRDDDEPPSSKDTKLSRTDPDSQIADKPSPSGGFLFFNGVMLKTPMPTQHELEMVTLEELVPKD